MTRRVIHELPLRHREHVIRNDRELEERREYILSNPALWDEDEENPGAELRQ